ncbi:MAG: LPS export ABC transporter permease LptG [Pseudomonadales bacterium]|nr:LPS export ABC transporter permease LptG [Pseudomonadales bacterium]
MNKILSRYIGLEVLWAVCFASAGLVGLLAVFTFLEEIKDFQNRYDFVAALTFIGLSVPRLFYETLPFSILIGGLVGLGGLAAKSELIVMRAAGVSTFRIVIFAAIPCLLFALAGSVVGEFVLPKAEREARLGRQQARDQAETIAPEFGVWTRDGEAFLHLAAVRDAEISGLKWYLFEQQKLILTRSARGAEYRDDDANPHWMLFDVTEVRFSEQGSELMVWPEKIWLTQLTPSSIGNELLVQPERMSVSSLSQKIERLESEALNSEGYRLGYWSKVLQPFVALSLLLLAASAVFGPLRESSVGMRIFTGLVIGVLFKFLQDLLAPVALVYGVPPLLAVIAPIGICLWFGFWQLRKAG